MSRSGRAIRAILFCIFLGVGIGAIVFSIVVGEISEYYTSSDALIHLEADNEKLKKLSAEYDLQLAQASSDPEILERLQRVTLGEQPESEDTIYPKASRQDMAAAEAVILAGQQTVQHDDPFRKIVDRCMQENIRLSLFLAGMGLVLLTFLFFSTKRPKRPLKDIRFQKGNTH
jgi:hypothetical protein